MTIAIAATATSPINNHERRPGAAGWSFGLLVLFFIDWLQPIFNILLGLVEDFQSNVLRTTTNRWLLRLRDITSLGLMLLTDHSGCASSRSRCNRSKAIVRGQFLAAPFFV